MAHALIVSPCDRSTYAFRRPQILELLDRGYRVSVATPDGPWVEEIRQLGASHHIVNFCRFPSLARDAKTLLSLARLIRRLKPDVVHSINTKAVVLGSFAARLAGVPRITNTFPGTGYTFFDSETGSPRRPPWHMRALVRSACGFADRTLFVNRDDVDLYVHHGLISPAKSAMVRSEGIDISTFSPIKISEEARSRTRGLLASDANTVIVLMMVARVTKSKGTLEFLEASRAAAEWGVPVRFVLAGPLDPECPDPIREELLSPTDQFNWIGWRDDVAELLAASDIVSLPSFYREGVPVTLLEALATGKPIVTTDHVGCREVVDNGRNGFLVPPRNAGKLAYAIRKIAIDARLRSRFAAASRQKAENEFCDRAISAQIVDALYGNSPTKARPASAAA